jgi:V/A-type H+-transporting ATPase subunit E
MSLAQITEKIRSDAQREADEILAKARTKAATIMQRAGEETDSIKSGFIRRFEVERPEIFRRREIVANLDVKRMMLKSSRDLIQDVYDLALENLRTMEKDEYIRLSEALLKSAMKSGDEEIEVSADEKYLDHGWLDAFNKENGSNLVFSEKKAGITGGFLLTKGKISTNCSWDMLIQMAREKRESDVVKRLFPPAGE